MVVIIEGAEGQSHQRLLETMFEDRKRLFVDLLKWDVPVHSGRFEQDAFDGDDAIYLIALDHDGLHAGSMRLLPTTKPHILSELFGSLCDGAVPAGPATLEITRLCLPTRYRAAERLVIRNHLISAMVDYCLSQGIDVLTGVVEAKFRLQVLEMGWRCSALGEAKHFGGPPLGAFRLEIEMDTPERLCRTGIYSPRTIRSILPDQVAA